MFDWKGFNATGTGGPDHLVGDKHDNHIKGLGGNDVLEGRGGDDSLYGGNGKDRLIGGFGDDTLSGGAAADRFIVDARGFGIDHIVDFQHGVDKIDVSALHITSLAQYKRYAVTSHGSSVLSLDWHRTGHHHNESIVIDGTTTASLRASDFIFDTSHAHLDVSGNGGIDVLFGALGKDTLRGKGGDNSLNGGPGDDTLVGGPGSDSLYGGGGDDRFVYYDSDVTTAFTDHINDFIYNTNGEHDVIDLSPIDADVTQPGNQQFDLVIHITGPAQVHLVTIDSHHARAEINVDADPTPDMIILIDYYGSWLSIHL